jgi:hypothetical protein
LVVAVAARDIAVVVAVAARDDPTGTTLMRRFVTVNEYNRMPMIGHYHK